MIIPTLLSSYVQSVPLNMNQIYFHLSTVLPTNQYTPSAPHSCHFQPYCHKISIPVQHTHFLVLPAARAHFEPAQVRLSDLMLPVLNRYLQVVVCYCCLSMSFYLLLFCLLMICQKIYLTLYLHYLNYRLPVWNYHWYLIAYCYFAYYLYQLHLFPSMHPFSQAQASRFQLQYPAYFLSH